MTLQRVLAVLAALFLVAAVGLATLAPPYLPLGQMLLAADATVLERAERAARAYLPPWVWTGIAMPLLLRPTWLIPAAIGIIAAGLAVTVTPRRGATRPRRRG